MIPPAGTRPTLDHDGERLSASAATGAPDQAGAGDRRVGTARRPRRWCGGAARPGGRRWLPACCRSDTSPHRPRALDHAGRVDLLQAGSGPRGGSPPASWTPWSRSPGDGRQPGRFAREDAGPLRGSAARGARRRPGPVAAPAGWPPPVRRWPRAAVLPAGRGPPAVTVPLDDAPLARLCNGSSPTPGPHTGRLRPPGGRRSSRRPDRAALAPRPPRPARSAAGCCPTGSLPGPHRPGHAIARHWAVLTRRAAPPTPTPADPRAAPLRRPARHLPHRQRRARPGRLGRPVLWGRTDPRSPGSASGPTGAPTRSRSTVHAATSPSSTRGPGLAGRRTVDPPARPGPARRPPVSASSPPGAHVAADPRAGLVDPGGRRELAAPARGPVYQLTPHRPVTEPVGSQRCREPRCRRCYVRPLATSRRGPPQGRRGQRAPGGATTALQARSPGGPRGRLAEPAAAGAGPRGRPRVGPDRVPGAAASRPPPAPVEQPRRPGRRRRAGRTVPSPTLVDPDAVESARGAVRRAAGPVTARGRFRVHGRGRPSVARSRGRCALAGPSRAASGAGPAAELRDVRSELAQPDPPHRWSGPLWSTSVARPRVGRMFCTRLGSLIGARSVAVRGPRRRSARRTGGSTIRVGEGRPRSRRNRSTYQRRTSSVSAST